MNSLNDLNQFYLAKEEPVKSCFLAMRDIILNYDERITEAWKYKLPMFCFNRRNFCYLWTHKKYKQPYLGVVEGSRIDHPLLLQENRKRISILLLDPADDIPLDSLYQIFDQARKYYP